MSDFNELKVKFVFGCGYVHKREDEDYLSNYIDEDDWLSMNGVEKELFLDDIWLEWKSNYETGGAWVVEDGE